MTGDATRPRGEAQTRCRGEHNPARKRSKLGLDGGRDVRKPSRTSIVHGTEIVRQILEARRPVRLIPFSACTLSVETTTHWSWLHPADLSGSRFGYPGNIAHPRLDNLLPQRDAQKREYERGTNGIGSGQLTTLCWTRNLAFAIASYGSALCWKSAL
jgi:hypothetical protein